MTSPIATAPRTQPDAADAGWAESFLDELMAHIGVDGLVAALRDPGLAVKVERHVGAVWAMLDERGLRVQAASLAGYAGLVVVAMMNCGRVLPADPGAVDWAGAEWHLVRLVAVCSLAERSGLL